MAHLSFADIISFCGGEYAGNTGVDTESLKTRFADGIVTDSRKPVAGAAFVALRGENFDGHRFVKAALEKGAVCCIVSDEAGFRAGAYGAEAILVPDTLKALGDIAAGYLRTRFPELRRIAVTGSVGKTTTKELVHAVLSAGFRAEKTPLSFNNEVGLPSTVLELPADTELFVAEMAMRGLGHIKYLVNIVRPEAAVITTIGNAHLELLGSRENILRAKMEVCCVPESAGETEDRENGDRPCSAVENGDRPRSADKPFRLIVNGDNDLLRDTARLRAIAAEYGRDDIEIITFGQNAAANYRAAEVVSGEHGINYLLICPEGNYRVDLAMPGEHNVYNSLAAIAAGSIFGIDPGTAVGALARYLGECGGENSVRQRKVSLAGGRLTLIDDAYNAGPESMPASLKVLGSISADRHIAALGDMVELGPRSPEFHLEVGRTAAKYCDRIFTVGEKAKNYVTGYGDSVHTAEAVDNAEAAGGAGATNHDTTDEAFKLIKEYIDGELKQGSTVAILVKGSHIMHMERISRLLEEAYR